MQLRRLTPFKAFCFVKQSPDSHQPSAEVHHAGPRGRFSVIVVSVLHFIYGKENIRKLNLPNQKRKLISGVLDVILEKVESHDEIRDCFEKRALWCGLLHHIHYVSKSETGRLFVYEIRNAKANQSVYAAFEGEMAAGNPVRAAEILRKGKGR